jgi:hypothetical protein
MVPVGETVLVAISVGVGVIVGDMEIVGLTVRVFVGMPQIYPRK